MNVLYTRLADDAINVFKEILGDVDLNNARKFVIELSHFAMNVSQVQKRLESNGFWRKASIMLQKQLNIYTRNTNHINTLRVLLSKTCDICMCPGDHKIYWKIANGCRLCPNCFERSTITKDMIVNLLGDDYVCKYIPCIDNKYTFTDMFVYLQKFANSAKLPVSHVIKCCKIVNSKCILSNTKYDIKTLLITNFRLWLAELGYAENMKQIKHVADMVISDMFKHDHKHRISRMYFVQNIAQHFDNLPKYNNHVVNMLVRNNNLCSICDKQLKSRLGLINHCATVHSA